MKQMLLISRHSAPTFDDMVMEKRITLSLLGTVDDNNIEGLSRVWGQYDVWLSNIW